MSKKYQLEKNIEDLEESLIINGDSLDIMNKLPSKSVHLVFTSPPYMGIKREYVDHERDLGQMEMEDYKEEIFKYIVAIERILRHEDGCVFILNLGEKYIDGFASNYIEELILRVVRETPLKVIDKVPWIKVDPMPGPKSGHGKLAWEYNIIFGSQLPGKLNKNPDALRSPYRATTLDIAQRRNKESIRKQTGHKINDAKCYNNFGAEPMNYVVCTTSGLRDSSHKAQMPLALAEYFVLGYSRPEQFVLDPFGGSGTTSHAAKMYGRKFIHIDLSYDNCEITERRLRDIHSRDLINFYGLSPGSSKLAEIKEKTISKNLF